MTVETYCVCGTEINRTYGRPSGTPMSGKNSLKVRVSLTKRLVDEHPSRIHLCRSCRGAFVQRRAEIDGFDGGEGGTARLCDFCDCKVEDSIRKNLKGPLGAVKSWSGRKCSGHDDVYERLDICVDCQRAFIDFVEEKKG